MAPLAMSFYIVSSRALLAIDFLVFVAASSDLQMSMALANVGTDVISKKFLSSGCVTDARHDPRGKALVATLDANVCLCAKLVQGNVKCLKRLSLLLLFFKLDSVNGNILLHAEICVDLVQN